MSVQPCPPPTAVTTGIVVFVLSEFAAQYPEMSTITSTQGAANFARASLLLDNTCGSAAPGSSCGCGPGASFAAGSPVVDANIRQLLLYMLTAHITYLNTPCAANGNNPPQAVGRVSNAAQGSVSAALDMPANPEAAWYLQTKYGAEYWNVTAPFRSLRSVPAPRGGGYGLPFEGFGSGLGPVGTGWGGYNGGSG